MSEMSEIEIEPNEFNTLTLILYDDEIFSKHCLFLKQFLLYHKQYHSPSLIQLHKITIDKDNDYHYQLIPWKRCAKFLDIIYLSNNLNKQIMNCINMINFDGKRNRLVTLSNNIRDDVFIGSDWKMSHYLIPDFFMCLTDIFEIKITSSAFKMFQMYESVHKVDPTNDRSVLLKTEILKHVKPPTSKKNRVGDQDFDNLNPTRVRNPNPKCACCFYCHGYYDYDIITLHEARCDFAQTKLIGSDSVVFVVTIGDEKVNKLAELFWDYLKIRQPSSFLTKIRARDQKDFCQKFNQSSIFDLKFATKSTKGKIFIYVFDEIFSTFNDLQLISQQLSTLDNLNLMMYCIVDSHLDTNINKTIFESQFDVNALRNFLVVVSESKTLSIKLFDYLNDNPKSELLSRMKNSLLISLDKESNSIMSSFHGVIKNVNYIYNRPNLHETIAEKVRKIDFDPLRIYQIAKYPSVDCYSFDESEIPFFTLKDDLSSCDVMAIFERILQCGFIYRYIKSSGQQNHQHYKALNQKMIIESNETMCFNCMRKKRIDLLKPLDSILTLEENCQLTIHKRLIDPQSCSKILFLIEIGPVYGHIRDFFFGIFQYIYNDCYFVKSSFDFIQEFWNAFGQLSFSRFSTNVKIYVFLFVNRLNIDNSHFLSSPPKQLKHTHIYVSCNSHAGVPVTFYPDPTNFLTLQNSGVSYNHSHSMSFEQLMNNLMIYQHPNQM